MVKIKSLLVTKEEFSIIAKETVIKKKEQLLVNCCWRRVLSLKICSFLRKKRVSEQINTSKPYPPSTY